MGRSSWIIALGLWGLAAGCGGGASGVDAGPTDANNPLTNPTDGPAAGNPDAPCSIPAEAGFADGGGGVGDLVVEDGPGVEA